jgi:hypothetical protein
MSDNKEPNQDDQPSTAPLLPGAPAVEDDAQPRLKKARTAVDKAEEESTEQDSSQLDAAVDDITVHEADQLLEAEDNLNKAFEPKTPAQGWRAKLKAFLAAWGGNPKARYGSLAGLVVLLVLVAAIPYSRYFVLNNVGVRASANLTILDKSTQQPLKNVRVQLAGQSAQTDSNGRVKLEHLKLGKSQLQISRRAFATVSQPQTVGWGSNPLGAYKLTPTGSQYTFLVTDFLSGKPQSQAQASFEDAEAQADDKGKIVLTIDADNSSDQLTVNISQSGFRTEKVAINPDDKAVHNVQMVPAQKHLFVSKRSGTLDLYSVYVDGQGQKLLLAGSGYERNDMVVIAQPNSKLAAVVSTRQNAHDSQGYLLSNLYVIDTDSGQLTSLAQSQKIQVLGWTDGYLVYVQVAAGASAANPKRQRLISYNVDSNSKNELASSNYFNDMQIAQGQIYYAPSDAYQSNPVGLYKVKPDGSGRQTVLPKQVWNIFRDSYSHFNLSVGQDWYGYNLGDVIATKSPNAPANMVGRLYQDSPDDKHSLWVDKRDGKGVLLEYEIGGKSDKVLVTQSGLTTPVYWLNNHYVVYRIQTDQQTADYVLNLDGGQPRKISDVTATAGVTQWYYY